MKKIAKQSILFLMFIICACNKNRQTPEDNISTVSGEMIVYHGMDNNAALSNPLMGWQCSGSPQDIAQHGIPDEFDIGVIRCSWDKLEPTKNGYDFELLDKAVNRLKQDGKSVYFRFYLMPDNVWNIDGYPSWIKQETGIGTFKHVHFDNLNGMLPSVINFAIEHLKFEI